MNRPETVKLLAQMAAMDRRTLGDAEVVAWQGVLDDVDFTDAVEAVRRHYRENDSYLMPVHVRRGATQIALEREKAARKWEPGQYGIPVGEALPEVTGRIAEGDVAPSVMRMLAELRTMLPEGSREKLMPRTAYWDREQAAYQRAQGEPNPAYRPEAAAEGLRADCRMNGPHDSGYHVDTCPDAAPVCTCNYNNMSGGHTDSCPLATY